MNNRRTVFIVSFSVSLGLAMAIITTTVLLTKPREISYEEATAATPLTQNSVVPDAAKSVLQPANQPRDLLDANTQASIGAVYATGQGATQDYQEALKWLRLSAAQGNPGGQLNLGVAYNNGNGIKQNYQEAMKWYRLSAEQGTSMAQSYLGDMYANGQGVPQDYTQAMMWYLIAKANDSTLPDQNLRQLESQTTPAQIAEAQRMAREWWAAHHPEN